MAEKEKTEMVEEEKPTEMEGDNQTENATETEGADELEKTRAALKKANSEAAKYRKKVDAYEADEKKRKEDEMSELEKRDAKIAELEAKAKALEIDALKRAAAEKVGLPANLASRLIGETAEELEADAQALLETLPKAPQKSPGVNTTNPSGGSESKESDADRRRRLGIG